jgi:hypothetical protein
VNRLNRQPLAEFSLNDWVIVMCNTGVLSPTDHTPTEEPARQ